MDRIEFGDCREIMSRWADDEVQAQTCVTSPPYFGLRDYKVEGQIGLEPTPDEYVAAMVDVFRSVRRVLRDDGTLWLVLGDSYNGSGWSGGLKPKDLVGIPWRVAFALQADGWYLRQDIIWHKPNPMPESVRDRCTKSHESIFLLSKQPRYYFDHEVIKEPIAQCNPPGKKQYSTKKYGAGNRGNYGLTGLAEKILTGEHQTRNRRSVWTVTKKPFKGAHFAVFPPDLIEPCILAGCPEGGIVLDPFMGSGTTAMVAVQHRRHYLGCELNPEYADMQQQRVDSVQPNLFS